MRESQPEELRHVTTCLAVQMRNGRAISFCHASDELMELQPKGSSSHLRKPCSRNYSKASAGGSRNEPVLRRWSVGLPTKDLRPPKHELREAGGRGIERNVRERCGKRQGNSGRKACRHGGPIQ